MNATRHRRTVKLDGLRFSTTGAGRFGVFTASTYRPNSNPSALRLGDAATTTDDGARARTQAESSARVFSTTSVWLVDYEAGTVETVKGATR